MWEVEPIVLGKREFEKGDKSKILSILAFSDNEDSDAGIKVHNFSTEWIYWNR